VSQSHDGESGDAASSRGAVVSMCCVHHAGALEGAQRCPYQMGLGFRDTTAAGRGQIVRGKS
jgi:hypothetical protein